MYYPKFVQILLLVVGLSSWSDMRAAAFDENDFSISSSRSSAEPSYVQEYRQYLKDEGFDELCVIENFASRNLRHSVTSRGNLDSQQTMLGANMNASNLCEVSVDSTKYMCDFLASHQIVILDLSVADRLEEAMDGLLKEKKTEFLSCLQKSVTVNGNTILELQHINQVLSDLSVQNESLLWKSCKNFAVSCLASTVVTYVVAKAYLHYRARR